uniref:Putative farnesoic acid o-methyltransferase n=1 Tax=Panstrongylus lignarius TaxID=156445 RepID=A0A224XP38_9HEMI
MVLEIQTEDKLEYKFVPNTTQAVKFKVKATNDAHVALTQEPQEGTPMYEIFFGGWGNAKIAIRKNREKPEVVTQDLPNTLSGDMFKDFWITWYDGTVAVGVGENATPLLVWSDPTFRALFVGVRTGWGATGSWIIEDNWPGWRSPQAAFLQSANEPGWNVPSTPGTAPTWVPCTGGTVPPDAVAGGFDQEQLYVGRAHHCGALLPGKVHPSHGVCYVAWGGSEHGIPEYEVLCGCQPSWVPATSDQVPPSALPAGQSEDNEPLYVGRAQHDDKMVVGKVQKSHSVCYISYAGLEIPKEEYEVLVV